MAKNNELTTLINQFIADSRKLHENGESVKKVAELFFEDKYQSLLLIPDRTFFNPDVKNKVKHFFSLWCAWTVICGLCVLFFIPIY